MAARNPMERRLRFAGLLALLGLLVEALALLWNHPTAFLAFAMIGVPLVLLGVLVFLLSLVSRGSAARDSS